MRISFPTLRLLAVAVALIAFGANAASARDAAFLDPSSSNTMGEEAVKVDPKPEVDVGETALNVAKRTSIFFVNQTNLPVKIEKVAVNGDSNVTAEATANDCTKQGSIAPLSRCSVEISATPSSPGAWSIDVLMTHNGTGRITRARITGKTTGTVASESKSTGLAVNTKEIKPVDFGDVTVGSGKIVRSTLMINDSPEPITLYAIDVIEADNGLQRLEQGCAVDMELAPGASCPVTLLWVPQNNGPVSTDLIIRHSGKQGFAVIPVRGNAKGGTDMAASSVKIDQKSVDIGKGGVPMPPSATDLENAMAGKVVPIPAGALGPAAEPQIGGDNALHLIGTIGERGLFLKPDGETVTVGRGEEFDSGTKSVKVVAVGPHSVEILIDGTRKKTLMLEAASSLVAKAADQMRQDAAASQSHGIVSVSSSPQSVSISANGVHK